MVVEGARTKGRAATLFCFYSYACVSQGAESGFLLCLSETKFGLSLLIFGL